MFEIIIIIIIITIIIIIMIIIIIIIIMLLLLLYDTQLSYFIISVKKMFDDPWRIKICIFSSTNQ